MKDYQLVDGLVHYNVEHMNGCEGDPTWRGEWYHEECMPIPKQFGERTQKYEWYCVIVYILLIRICVHLDTLKINVKYLYIHSESSTVYMHGDTRFTSESCMGYSIH